jgi:hypothetical protein
MGCQFKKAPVRPAALGAAGRMAGWNGSGTYGRIEVKVQSQVVL